MIGGYAESRDYPVESDGFADVDRSVADRVAAMLR